MLGATEQRTDPTQASPGTGADSSTLGREDDTGTDDGATTPGDGEGDGGAPTLLELGAAGADDGADGVTLVVNRGSVWTLEGRLDGTCDDLELRSGTTVLAEGAAGEDGAFTLEVATIGLPAGEQTVALYCGSEPEPLGEAVVLIAQQVDSSGGPAEAGVLLCVLLFFLLMVLMGVSVPLPRADVT